MSAIRWLRSKFDTIRARLRKQIAETQELLEDLAEFTDEHGPEFLRLIETVGPLVEAQVVAIESFPGVTGAQKLTRVLQWVRENNAELTPYLKQLSTWISAVVAARKALGLFK